RNMPHCCLPWESGPCLSPNVAGHPLRPATRHCLGAPLPHQLADRPRAPPPALKLSSTVQVDHGTYAVLPGRWAGYSPQAGRLLTCYAPVRRSPPKECPRLACVKHAASVRPEPGSNSPREMKQLDKTLARSALLRFVLVSVNLVYILCPPRTSTADRREPRHIASLDCQKALPTTASTRKHFHGRTRIIAPLTSQSTPVCHTKHRLQNQSQTP